jgi:uncharacterized membrane protein
MMKIILRFYWAAYIRLLKQVIMEPLTYLIVLRLLHILCGVFWAGAAIYLAAFIAPAVRALGPDGGKFMQKLARTNNLPLVMTFASTVTVITGILLLWELSGGFQIEWMTTKHGLVLNTGALLTVIAYLEGLMIIRPTVSKLNALTMQLAGGGPPSSEQLQLLNSYRQKIFTGNTIAAILLAITVIAMSLVRYI